MGHPPKEGNTSCLTGSLLSPTGHVAFSYISWPVSPMLSCDLRPQSFWRPCHFPSAQQLGCVHVWFFSKWGMSSHAQEGVMVTKQAWCHHGQVHDLLQGSHPIWGLQADSESQLSTLPNLSRFCLTKDHLLVLQTE